MKTLSEYVRARITRLVAYKAGADIVSKLVTLAVTVAAARVLAPEAFGVFALAMTTGWILGVASDAGLPLYLARAAASPGGGVSRIFGHVARVRLALAAGALAGAGLAALVWAPPALRGAFLLIGGASIAGAVLETIAHLFRGRSRSDIESAVTLVQRLATAALAAMVLWTTPSLTLLGLALAVPPAIAVLLSLGIASRLLRAEGTTDGRDPQAAASDTSRLLREAAPIGIGVLLSAIYFRCDLYFLEHWRGLDEVGMYNAVFRLVEAARLAPAAVLAVAFPALVQARSFAPLQRLARPLTAAGVAGLAVMALAAPLIVDAIYGLDYLAAAPALRVLALALPFFFLNYALTHQVIAWDGQKAYAIIAGAALVSNLAANVVCIPTYGMVGAAAATVLTEVVVTAGCLVALRTRGAVMTTATAS